MDAEVLKTVGQVAGIGGVVLGVFLLLFRDIIRKHLCPALSPATASGAVNAGWRKPCGNS